MTMPTDPKKLLPGVLDVARAAGHAISLIYARPDLGVELKADDSPLTAADRAAHGLIAEGLRSLAPHVPLGSEESALISGGSDASSTSMIGIPSIDGLGPRGTGFHTREELIEITTRGLDLSPRNETDAGP